MPTNRPRRPVELHQAFAWVCDDCGRDNFARAVTVEPAAIGPGDLPAAIGPSVVLGDWIAEGGAGHGLRAPREVTCQWCWVRFAVVAE